MDSFLEDLPPKSSTIYRGAALLPPRPLPKARSSSPAPFSDETNRHSQPEPPQVFLTNPSRRSIDEETNSPSPLPRSSDEFSFKPENDNDDQPKSVQSVRILLSLSHVLLHHSLQIRAFFNEQRNFPLQRHEQALRSNYRPGRISIPNTLTIPNQLPVQSQASPERFIKSQSYDGAVEIADSATGDSSLSSNHNLSPSNSSDTSFSDEDDNSSDERV